MKKFFNILAAIILAGLILVCVYFIFKTPIDNLINKAKDSFGNVTVEIYVMDPDTNNYQKSTKKINVKEGTSYTYSPASKEYYTIDTTKSELTIENASKDSIIKVYYNCEKCTITFELNGGESSEDLVYEINKGHSFFAPKIVKPGYKIVSYNNYVEKIYADTLFTPNWELDHYIVTLVLPEGCTINDSNFTKIEDSNNYAATITYLEELTLPDVSTTDYIFFGWKINGEGSFITSINNVSEDINIIGSFNVKMYTITFVEENGVYYSPITAKKNTKIDPPRINPLNNIPGYGLVWYEDSDYTTPYSFAFMPATDLELYGKWELDRGTGFIEYNISKSTIDSLDDFTNCIDYVYFNYITSGFSKEITYCSASEVNNEFKKASALAEYRSNTPIIISTTYNELSGKITVEIKVETNTKSYEGSITALANETNPYNVVGYVEGTNLRDATFNDFYIEKITQTYEVSTTNQLLYVVEHGYKPICTNSALDIYNKAKNILRNIVNDDMTDFEKLERIYEYLVLNVQYDYNVLSADHSWEYYDAYFMEGVFNNKKAVCDGIAKSLVLLCNIEGIPCVEVSGNNHAWCQVKIKNLWYVIDATHGNLRINSTNKTVLDFSEFLISKALKQEKGYQSSEFSNIKCNQIFDYFGYNEYSYGANKINLVVNNYHDLEKIMEYANSTEADLDNYSINFKVNTTSEINTLVNLAQDEFRLKTGSNFKYSISWSYDSSLTYKVCKLLFTK